MKKNILFFCVALALLGSARAQNDSTYTWHLGEYPYYFSGYDWPEAFMLNDSNECKPRPWSFYPDDNNSWDIPGVYVNEYAVLHHTDDTIEALGIAMHKLDYYSTTWQCEFFRITLYDSAMNELYHVDELHPKCFHHAGDDFYSDIEGTRRVLLPYSKRNGHFLEFPVKDIKLAGDFYIGMRHHGGDSLWNITHNSYEMPLFLHEGMPLYPTWQHQPPYHYDGHKFRMKIDGVWDTLLTSHYMPLVFVIYDPWCKAPVYVSADSMVNGCVNVQWSTDAMPSSWEVSVMGIDTTLIYTTTNTNIRICGLSPEESYTVRVRSVCIAADGREKRSSWSIAAYVNRTVDIGIYQAEYSPAVSVMPNPAHSSVMVQCSESIMAVEIITMKGEMLQRHNAIGAQSCTLDLTGLAKGIYIVQITTSQGTAARKLAVE